MNQKLKALEARILELEAFAGVLVHVFEKEYKRQNYDFSVDAKPAKSPKRK